MLKQWAGMKAQTKLKGHKMLRTAVMKGNSKLGDKETWNVNLPPKETCEEMPCYNEGCCYNCKAWRMYPSVRDSWMNNWNHYQENPIQFFDDICERIDNSRKLIPFFRWQAAGDIADQQYFEGMKSVSKNFPKIQFLAFTKKYEINFRQIPENLEVVISAWPGLDLPKHLSRRFSIAWMLDGREERYKLRRRKIFQCKGYCPSCRICWVLSKIKQDVAFKKH